MEQKLGRIRKHPRGLFEPGTGARGMGGRHTTAAEDSIMGYPGTALPGGMIVGCWGEAQCSRQRTRAGLTGRLAGCSIGCYIGSNHSRTGASDPSALRSKGAGCRPLHEDR